MTMTVRIAQESDLAGVAELFDAYRQFYGQPANIAVATAFIGSRLHEGSSLILVATNDAGAMVAFTQLYPLFDSVGATPSFVLYDLYVRPDARRAGVAKQLMHEARSVARQRGAGRIELQTGKDNTAAQRLYESLGWVRDTDFFIYAITP
ncbi:GNAT family N-acetyltransferase [Stenotrophomonas sp. 24(2023)]|uniref:GNAT family N-acetyltransferase n=1 Tax=Stenotrophomonas sp. 24(2023) TaxID=3068324 RepID=UPI0027DF60E0|nr:GNAT family N-acetyltransferase [Stenotrophomonas sp. 24(2023)]WMJ69208.1 GNAT family N-acetyltransferase [Stenotrophomonas sp. 24(2023)]